MNTLDLLYTEGLYIRIGNKNETYAYRLRSFYIIFSRCLMISKMTYGYLDKLQNNFLLGEIST